MSERNEGLTKFTDAIAGGLHQMLRAAGVGMAEVKSHERIREAAVGIAKSIEHRGEVTAVRVIKKLQTAVSEGFRTTETEIEDLKTQMLELTRAVRDAQAHIADLKQRL